MSESHAGPGETLKARDQRIEELGQIIEAYDTVTVKMQAQHETLTAEVRRLQEELASANAALQRGKRLAALGEMAAGIAHEIRNPLASIQLYASMLEEDLEQMPIQKDIAIKITQGVRGLNGIVQDVLAFSREMRLRPTPVSPGNLYARVIDATRPLIDQHDISLSVTEDEDTVFNADPELLHQALVNLTRNAAEAVATAEHPRLNLDVLYEDGDKFVRLIIADNGPGIDETLMDRVFNPFFTTRETGTGLGLAIVHRIVDAHGGSISIENKDGAVFTLNMPVEPRLKEQEEAMYTVDF